MVTDYRGQRPIIERVVGEPNSQLVGELGTATRAAPPPPKPFWRNWFVLFNAALLAIVLIVVSVRSVRRHSRA
jgi:hypothetical protein